MRPEGLLIVRELGSGACIPKRGSGDWSSVVTVPSEAGMRDVASGNSWRHFARPRCHRAAARAAGRATKSARSSSSRKMARRSRPRTITWWRVPVEDPGRRAGPKVPDEERKGSRRGWRGMARGSVAQGSSGCNVPHYGRVRQRPRRIAPLRWSEAATTRGEAPRRSGHRNERGTSQRRREDLTLTTKKRPGPLLPQSTPGPGKPPCDPPLQRPSLGPRVRLQSP